MMEAIFWVSTAQLWSSEVLRDSNYSYVYANYVQGGTRSSYTLAREWYSLSNRKYPPPRLNVSPYSHHIHFWRNWKSLFFICHPSPSVYFILLQILRGDRWVRDDFLPKNEYWLLGSYEGKKSSIPHPICHLFRRNEQKGWHFSIGKCEGCGQKRWGMRRVWKIARLPR